MEQALGTGHATEPKDLTDESEVKAQVKTEVETEIQPRSDTAGPKANAKRKLPPDLHPIQSSGRLQEL
jgi:hypothetical protein